MLRRTILTVMVIMLLGTTTGCASKQPAAQGGGSGPQVVEPGQAITDTGADAENAAGAANSVIEQQEQQLENAGAVTQP